MPCQYPKLQFVVGLFTKPGFSTPGLPVTPAGSNQDELFVAHNDDLLRNQIRAWLVSGPRAPDFFLPLEALVSAGRSEMQSEGVTGQTDGNAVIGRHIYRQRSRRSNPLHRDVLRGQRYLMVLGFLNNRVRSTPGPSCADSLPPSMPPSASRPERNSCSVPVE